jgi:pyruvate/2-oxoacid:ferredoxin oxidoreductase beta subunit
MLVVDSGNGHAGQWREVVRDVAADFRVAFGEPVPAISGVAVAADTDNSGERVEARFGDLWFEARP